MKNIIQKIILAITPLFCCILVVLPVHAMSDEEKELFDSIGIEYTVDENGDFKEFVVSPNTPRMSYEKRLELAQKYLNTKKVGKYKLLPVVDTQYNGANFYIYKEDDTPIFMATDSENTYVSSSGDFLSLNFMKSETDMANGYTKGVLKEGDERWPSTYEEYSINKSGEYVIRQKIDGNTLHEYNAYGELCTTYDYDSDCIYDENGALYKVTIKAKDDTRSFSAITADEIQAVIDKNGGNMYQIQDGVKTLIPEIADLHEIGLICHASGLDLESCKERYEMCKKLFDNLPLFKVPVDMKARIFKVDKRVFWTGTDKIDDFPLPSHLSEAEISKLLVEKINNHRVKNGASVLDSSDSLLQEVANIRAEELTCVMDCAHSRPYMGNSNSLAASENSALTGVFPEDSTNETIADTLFEGWKSSPGHNANMLDVNHTQGCVQTRLVWNGDTLTAYSVTEFFDGNYQNDVSSEVKDMINLGPQTPDNLSNWRLHYDVTQLGEEAFSTEGMEVNATYDGSWQTLQDGTRVCWQDLVGDTPTINGMTPKYVMTQELQTAYGPKVTVILNDANYNMVTHCMNTDIEHTNYTYAYITLADVGGMVEISGTNESVVGNLIYSDGRFYSPAEGAYDGYDPYAMYEYDESYQPEHLEGYQEYDPFSEYNVFNEDIEYMDGTPSYSYNDSYIPENFEEYSDDHVLLDNGEWEYVGDSSQGYDYYGEYDSYSGGYDPGMEKDY